MGLRPAVLSVLGQSYGNLELILVIAGGQPTLADIDDPRLRRIEVDRGGELRDRGLAEARGQFVTFQGAADVSHPRRIERQVGCLMASPDLAAAFTGRDRLIDGKRSAPLCPGLDRDACVDRVRRGRFPDVVDTGMYRLPMRGNLEALAADRSLVVLADCLYSRRALDGQRGVESRSLPDQCPPSDAIVGGRDATCIDSGAPSGRRALDLALFGCAPDTGNLGVSALCFSVLAALKAQAPDTVVSVFDNGRGHRWGAEWIGGEALTFASHGGRYSRRLHESSSLWNLRVCARLGGLGNLGAQAVLGADAVLDVSGGDSFTDLYGRKRFEATIYPKRLALELGVPLVLLPQTYGPFRSARSLRIARRLVRDARMAWARDVHSFDVLREMLGEDYDPERHRLGVDMALGLGVQQPAEPLPKELEACLAPDRSRPVAGINVSGLIYGDPDEARTRYGLRADYRHVIDGLVEQFLAETDAEILLVPHVVSRGALTHDDDYRTCVDIRDRFAGGGGRVRMLEQDLNPSEMKGVISRLDWFCGTRMHSTIAALSTGVPVAAIAYSGKTLGVFESCGQGEQVADPRQLDTAEVRSKVWRSWCERERLREELQRELPGVLAKCRQQAREIVLACGGTVASADS